MAPATSPAAARSVAPRGRAALVAFALLSFAAPALAAEQVYIWRDQSGAVRFSAVRDSPQNTRLSSEGTHAPECPAQPAAVVLTEANQRTAY